MAADKVGLAVLILGMMMFGQGSANFLKCYADCSKGCLQYALDPIALALCEAKCLKGCIIHASSSGDIAGDYCNIGCALSTCANSLTDAAKMEGCLAACSTNACKRKA